MRIFLTIFAILFLNLGAYSYLRDPEDCKKIGHDVIALYESVTPVHVKVDMGTSSPATNSVDPSSSPDATSASASVPVSPPEPAALPTPVPLPTNALKAWTPPGRLPQQADWTWTTTTGKTYHQVKVVKVEADAVTILHADGGSLVPISTLPTELQKQLNYQPEAAQQGAAIRQQQEQQIAAERAQESGQARAQTQAQVQRTSTQLGSGLADSSQVKAIIGADLVSSSGSDWTFPSRGPGVQYLAIYFSAHWCPPCRAFTPELVSWYGKFKPSHPNFELVFMSEDNDEVSMFDYMKTEMMPWPAVRYDQRGMCGLRKFANTGIPDLVLVDSSGKVLSDSFQGSTYLGPEHVLDDIQKQLGD